MKGFIYGVLLFAGFILMVSESATVIPNFIGVATFAYAAHKLDLFISSINK